MNNQAGNESMRQTRTQTLRGGFVRQGKFGGNIGSMQRELSPSEYSSIAARIKELGSELGFSAVAVARAEVGEATPRLQAWLNSGFHGEMDYMARHADLRSNPQALVPGTLTVVSCALDYLPAHPTPPKPGEAVISRYAWGRDYHKIIRQRLQKLALALGEEIGAFGYRVFSDSAPVMEVEFARQSGLGWRGKHTLLLSRQGSWRFLGEIYTDLPLPIDSPQAEHCGTCTACLAACPTGAIVAPYQVDARRCISYLTIELAGSIPLDLRPLIGSRIYGCDDCQDCCPWNRFARIGDPQFAPRHNLDQALLIELFAWSEEDFNERLAGSPIRRIGHERWLRNIAVALGNATSSEKVKMALASRREHPSPLVREHVEWALARRTDGGLIFSAVQL